LAAASKPAWFQDAGETVHVRWTEAPDQYESLAVSLRAVLDRGGVDRSYDELVAVLGLGFATVAATDDTLDSWCTYARDAGLGATAESYGLRLRELHPPAATRGLARSAEYARHFQDSYVPLIARALEHDQLVLAWRGWPAPHDRLWGVITSFQGGTLGGHTLGADGRPLPLSGPAHQVYIVEESRPVDPSALAPAHLFAHAARQARAGWAGTWARCANVKTGAAAYRAWQDILRTGADGGAGVVPLYRQHAQAARVHGAARGCLAAWLRRVGPALASDGTELAAYWANTCDAVGEVLRPYESPAAVQVLLDHPGGAEGMCRAIDAICEMEAALVVKLGAVQ
jgi:hypothetical protein